MLALRVSLITLFYYYGELANGPGHLTKKKKRADRVSISQQSKTKDIDNTTK